LLRDVLRGRFSPSIKAISRCSIESWTPMSRRQSHCQYRAVGFVQERERVIRQQQEAIRELSTPVLQVRERLLICP